MTRTQLLLPLAALAAAVPFAGCGNTSNAQSPATTSSPSAPATTTTTTTPAAPANGALDVTVSEWSVKPSATTVAAGTVRLHMTNAGKSAHEVVVLKTDKPAGALGNKSRIPETGHVGEVGETPPGKSGTSTLHLKPGHYALVCNLPGHYMAGMHADLTVR